MQKYALIILSCFLLISCENTDEKNHKKEMEMQKSIFSIHDRLMSKMDKVVSLEDSLKNPHLLANPNYKGHLSDTLPVFKNMRKAYLLLDSGDQAMEKWMNSFKVDYKGKNHEETIQYLNDQLAQVKQIDSLVNSSIQKAESLISNKK